MNILNIAAYLFIDLPIDRLQIWQETFKKEALQGGLKGTVLLSEEGINLFLAGLPLQVRQFQSFLQSYPELNPLSFRETWSLFQPFRRLIVKLKKEIITFGHFEIKPSIKPAPYLEPETLRSWYVQGKEMTILDTRNICEVEMGTFVHSQDLKIKNFRSFPQAATQLPDYMKEKPIVTFCTGGIRCEKAALWLQKEGFKQVYQLKGGILNYFEKCADEYYHGKCFVFDDRNALEPEAIS